LLAPLLEARFSLLWTIWTTQMNTMPNPAGTSAFVLAFKSHPTLPQTVTLRVPAAALPAEPPHSKQSAGKLVTASTGLAAVAAMSKRYSKRVRTQRRVLTLVQEEAVQAERDFCFVHRMRSSEATLLAAFRDKLPTVLENVRKECEAAQTANSFSLWGINIEENTAASDIVLFKFLRAEDLKVDSAADRLGLTLKFRIEEGIEELAKAGLPEHFQGHDQITGTDVDGRPVIVSRFGNMDNKKVFGDPDAFTRYRLQIFEKALAMVSFEGGAAEDLCQVHDYSGVNLLFKSSEVKKGVAAMTKVFAAHYPETKGKTIFVNFPAVFSKMFQAFSYFIPERTRKKFQILGEADHSILFTQVRPELIPEALGGMLRGVATPNAAPCQFVEIKPRSTAEVVLTEIRGAGVIDWEMRACTGEVDYKLVFAPANGDPEIIVSRSLPGQPLLGKDGILTGEYCANSAGSLRCQFTNQAAWLQARTCVFRAGRRP